MQYNPSKKKLFGYGNIEVTISLSRMRTKREPVSNLTVDREAFGNLILNPGRQIEKRLGLLPSAANVKMDAVPPIRGHQPEFLIIYADGFKDAALKLADWKNRRGIITECVPISDIGNDISKIKDYIRKLRGLPASNLRYVLLFGDTDKIVTEPNIPCFVEEPEYTGNASDYYYSTKSDPIGPKDVLLPWISLGRIPMRSSEDGLSVVQQIISYERTPPVDPKYYKRIILSASFEDIDREHPVPDGWDKRGFLQTMELGVRPALVTMGYDVERIYVSYHKKVNYYVDGTPISEEVKAAMMDRTKATKRLIDVTIEGRLFVGHRDHGDEDGWGNPKFTMAHLDKISGDAPSMFYSINCLTGKFDRPGSKESFAEKNLRIKGGAPSLIAATRVSSSWLNDDLIKGLFDATFAGILPTFPGGVASYPIKASRLGDILNYAKFYLPVVNGGDPEGVKDHFEIYHVIGDPTLEIWKEAPRSIKIRAELKTGFSSNNLDIMISDCPTGTTLTIWKGDKLLKRLNPSSTHITITVERNLLTPTSDLQRPLLVCFWAPGYLYSEVEAGCI